MNKRLPYKAEIMYPGSENEVWWPVSSDPDDNMIIGDGIPGDKKTAELCARCCNIAYRQALDDIQEYLNSTNEEISRKLREL